ncbi:hypothetical protein PCANC_03077 [Puccinia coronata f. sp. avenae]|nr:hypothetical protein PCANC_03077 [Puccinia coronata f. sp. avenae]
MKPGDTVKQSNGFGLGPFQRVLQRHSNGSRLSFDLGVRPHGLAVTYGVNQNALPFYRNQSYSDGFFRNSASFGGSFRGLAMDHVYPVILA